MNVISKTPPDSREGFSALRLQDLALNERRRQSRTIAVSLNLISL